jgi:multiple sugar transport system permease protein
VIKIIKNKDRSEYFRSETRIKIFFLSPALITLAVVLILPVLFGVRNSFYQINLAKMYEGEKFIGFGNYIKALSDIYFARSLLVSLTTTFFIVAL